jgi:putative hydrolase of the HAD superfamily
MIRALLFDLDETLTVHESAYSESYAEMGALAAGRAEVDGTSFALSAPRLIEDMWQQTRGAEFTNRAGFGGRDVLWAGPGNENPELRALAATVNDFRIAVWAVLLAEQGASDQELATEIRNRFPQEMWSRIRAFADVRPALESVADKYTLVLVSNGMPSVQEKKLRRSGLDRFFEKRAVSGAVGEGKLSAKIFEAALELAGARPGEAVMFGDVLERDILGAQRLGICSVWVNRAGDVPAPGAPKADREVADLADLARLVGGL